MSTTEKILKALWNPIQTTAQGLADLEQFSGQKSQHFGDAAQKAYDEGRYGDMLKAGAGQLAANLTEFAAKGSKEGAASFMEIGGGNLLVDTKGGLSALYGITNRNNQYDALKIPKPTPDNRGANVNSDAEEDYEEKNTHLMSAQ